MGHRCAVVAVHGFEAGGAAEDEGAVGGLMAVKIGFCRSEHLREHIRFLFGDQRFDEHRAHWDVDADLARDGAGAEAAGQNNGIPFEDALVCFDDFQLAGLFLQSRDACFGVELHAEFPRLHVKGEGRLQRVGVAVSGAPARADNFVGHVGVDGLHFLAVDHPHVEAAALSNLGQAFENFQVCRGFPETEIAFFDVFDVVAQFVGQARPEIFDAVHGQGEFSRVTAGLADPAAVTAGAAVADNGAFFQYDDRMAFFCGVIRDGVADDAGTDHDHVCCCFH